MNTPFNSPESAEMSSFTQSSTPETRQQLSPSNSPAGPGSQIAPPLSPMSRFEAAIIRNCSEFHEAMYTRELALTTEPTIRLRRTARAMDEGRPTLPHPTINRLRSIAITMETHQQETEYSEFSTATRMNTFKQALAWESHLLESRLTREQELRLRAAWAGWARWELL